jgi:hypothetical protein
MLKYLLDSKGVQIHADNNLDHVLDSGDAC